MLDKNKKKKVVIISGKTASSKSSLAIFLAKKINGEIISADSRQIYKGLESFSGAVREEENQGIKHHLLSFKDPKERYTSDSFKKDAEKVIEDILSRDKIPIVVGGTAFYLESLLFENNTAKVEPDFFFREKMEEKSTEQLAQLLEEKSPQRAREIDLKNRHRVIRSLELIEKLGLFPFVEKRTNTKYDFLFLTLFLEKSKVDLNIEKNFNKRKDFLIKEAERLRETLTREDFSRLGLAYKNIYTLWDGKIDEKEFTQLGIKEEQKYAKRQGTFLKRLNGSLNKKSFVYSPDDSFLKVKILIKTFIFLLK